MTEWAWILVVPMGWLCWAIGGTGAKWVRRYVYPALLSIALAVLGIVWWKWCWVAGWISLTAHLGYGDRATWAKRWFIGCCYACSLLPLAGAASSVTSWLLIPISAALLVGLVWASRRWNALTWKLCEGILGGWHSGAVVWLATH